MDKGFNDDELADIMSEIENLEKEFTEDMVKPEEVAPQEEPTAEKIVEEPVAVVEEVEATVEESVPIVEEVEAIVENSVEPVMDASAQVIAEPEEVVKSEAEPIIEASTDSIDEHETELNEVLGELSDMPVEEATGQSREAFEENVHEISKPVAVNSAKAPVSAGAGHSAMSFSVEGDMKLDLSFNISGKVVQLNISENGFELELDGGMKFSIPLDESSSHKKVA